MAKKSEFWTRWENGAIPRRLRSDGNTSAMNPIPKKSGGAIGSGKKAIKGPFDNSPSRNPQSRGKAPFSAGRNPHTGV